MHWLEFIASVLKTIIWPLCLIAIILLLKTQIRDLLPGLRNLKFKDFEMSFEKKMEAIEENPETIHLVAGTRFQAPIVSQKIAYLLALSESSPRSAIIESWLLVEEQINNLAQKFLKYGSYKTPKMILNDLVQEDIISADLYNIIENLRGIRNEAVHINKFYIHSHLIKEYIRNSIIVENALKQMLDDSKSNEDSNFA